MKYYWFTKLPANYNIVDYSADNLHLNQADSVKLDATTSVDPVPFHSVSARLNIRTKQVHISVDTSILLNMRNNELHG